ncbi:alpha/beta hydrolase-fold protein [Streptomyces sp. NPDC017201]|uniref:alpha/beta hydrolase-fold protein n=1 Tax=unclassified Streptomyces TaxID=2593676 RepID=UPI0033BBB7EC
MSSGTLDSCPENAFAAFGLPGTPGTDAFWAAGRAPSSVPADDGGWVTLFLWRGSPATLDFESWSKPVPLRRWGGTDCWYAEVRMPARLRVTYRFLVDDVPYADPSNPVGAGGDRSVVATPDAPHQPHWPVVGADDVLPVPGTRLRWAGGRLGGRRTVRVHPVGGGGPVVLLLDGDDWLYLHPAMTAFDAAFAAGEMPAVTLVFVPAKDRPAEFACRPELWEAVRDELPPLVAESGVAADWDRLVVAGQSLGGLSAVYAALEFPGLVSRVACQSPSFWWAPGAMDRADLVDGPVGGAVADRLRERPDLSGLRIAFDVGEHEARMLPHCELVEELTGRAGATVRVSRSASGHDRAGWRHALLRDVAWTLAR